MDHHFDKIKRCVKKLQFGRRLTAFQLVDFWDLICLFHQNSANEMPQNTKMNQPCLFQLLSTSQSKFLVKFHLIRLLLSSCKDRCSTPGSRQSSHLFVRTSESKVSYYEALMIIFDWPTKNPISASPKGTF